MFASVAVLVKKWQPFQGARGKLFEYYGGWGGMRRSDDARRSQARPHVAGDDHPTCPCEGRARIAAEITPRWCRDGTQIVNNLYLGCRSELRHGGRSGSAWPIQGDVMGIGHSNRPRRGGETPRKRRLWRGRQRRDWRELNYLAVGRLGSRRHVGWRRADGWPLSGDVAGMLGTSRPRRGGETARRRRLWCDRQRRD